MLVDRVAHGPAAERLGAEARSLKPLRLTPKQSCDLEMISIGAFSPLTGFMGREDTERVCREMRLTTGEIWPIPILLSVDPAGAPKTGERVALIAPNGVLQALMTVKESFPHDKRLELPSVFRTDDPAHPGVAQVLAEGDICLAGPVDTLIVCVDPTGPEAFLPQRLTPAQTRAEFDHREWATVAAFQTRNPIHRAHEYLCKVAQEICDGLLVHPLVGETKEGDIPARVRMECYRVLLDNYFVPERTLLSVMPAAMRYAGPREAVLHALIRKNYGCTHFIVGRDHAGVGSYYGSYDAQRIFDDLDPASLGITPLKFEHAAYSQRAGGMVSPKTFPNIPGDQVTLSGTKVRELLASGQRPPEEFTRAEVADVLIRWATGKP
jgi:sulfate adenylyltransferase